MRPLVICLSIGAIVAFGLAATADEPADAIAKRFDELDTNKDGKLSADELKKAPLIAQLLNGADTDNDGFITLAEARAHLAGRLGPKRKIDADKPDAKTAVKEPVRQGPKILKPTEVGVGRLIPDIAFTTIAGSKKKLSDFGKVDALVVAFTSTSCPLCQKYAPSLARLEKAFAGKPVAFLFVDPIATDAVADMRNQIEKLGLKSDYVHDVDQTLAAALNAKSTCEAFVLDARRTLRFRGALDDQYGQGYALDAPKTVYLETALNELLAGKTVSIPATTAPGCELDVADSKRPTAAVDYHGRISRIVQNACLECHRKEGLAPFSLETADDLAAHKGMIRKVVEAGTMPPWFAAAPAKGETTPWGNDRSLTDGDKKDLLAWLKSDLPRGNAADAPLPRAFPKDWSIGKPDLVLQLPRQVDVKAEGIMPYQNLIVNTELTEEKWIQAIEIQPTSRAVVHHVLVFVAGSNAKDDGRDPAADERRGFFAAYVPGNSTFVYPDGMAKKLPKGAKLRFQMHYTPNGTATKDQTRIGLIFAKNPPKHEVQVIGMVNPRLRIPPGADNHPETAMLPVPFDAKVISFMPHMHLRGKAFRYEAILPGGKTQTLLDVPAYDFNWQLCYRYAEPMPLPRGTMLKATGWYDNSDKNPANPDPKKTVKWGPQTTDEMMLGYLEFIVPGRAKE